MANHALYGKGLSKRTISRLYWRGFLTLQAIARETKDGLLAIPGFGATSLKEVENALAKEGLELRQSGGIDKQLEVMMKEVKDIELQMAILLEKKSKLRTSIKERTIILGFSPDTFL